MQVRLSEHIAGGSNRSAVRYTFHYKANDIKPLAAELYPHLAAGYEWWAWADLDVVFGDLLKFLRQASTRPACCKVPLKLNGPHKGEPKRLSAVNVYTHKVPARAPDPRTRGERLRQPGSPPAASSTYARRAPCRQGACPCTNGEQVNVVCPLYPNPWRKKAWGPFTAFRSSALLRTADGSGSATLRATALYRNAPQWTSVIASGDYAHFDEWWGPFHYERGWETMGDVLTRLAEEAGSVVMSKQKMAFAEAKTCRDGACMFCPCGAMRMSLHPSGALVVNGIEVRRSGAPRRSGGAAQFAARAAPATPPRHPPTGRDESLALPPAFRSWCYTSPRASSRGFTAASSCRRGPPRPRRGASAWR